METNLAYINEAVGAALEQERSTPTIPAAVRKGAEQKRLRVVAGFALNNESAVQRALRNAAANRRRSVTAYLKHRREVMAKLGTLGIKPLAILPKAAWERICAESGLYRLHPNKNGRVFIAGEKRLDAFERKAVWFNTALWIGILCIIVVVAAYFGYNNPPKGAIPSEWAFALASIVGVGSVMVGVFMGFFVLDAALYFATYNWLVRLQMGLYRFKSHAKLLHDFFPNGVSPAKSKVSATLVLPAPPQGVAAILLKAKDLDLKVAAVGEAIAFAETPAQIMQDEHVRRVEIREKQRAERHDPIVYHEHESAIAIIAQFGDFPVEREVVDRVVSSEHLL